MKLKFNKENKITITLVIVIIGLTLLNIINSKTLYIENPKNILFNKSSNTLNISSLTLKQKIAQMVIIYENKGNMDYFGKMAIGGAYL